MKINATKTKIFALIIALAMLTLMGCTGRSRTSEIATGAVTIVCLVFRRLAICKVLMYTGNTTAMAQNPISFADRMGREGTISGYSAGGSGHGMITVHKGQGGEFSVAVMPFTFSHYVMLQRNLLYTGVTKAKKSMREVVRYDIVRLY